MRSDFRVTVVCEDTGQEVTLVMQDEFDRWEAMRRAATKSGYANPRVVGCEPIGKAQR